MNRKLKALGLALVAAFAMSAFVASAQAAEFHAGEAHTTSTAGQTSTHVFTAGEGFGGVSCSKASFESTSTATTETFQTIKPAYSECKDSFGRTAHVTVNGCAYVFKGGTSTTANVDVECPEGKTIVVEVKSGGSTICTVTIGAQTNTGIVDLHNVAGGDVAIESTAGSVDNTTSGGFFNCGISNGLHTEGTYTGTSVAAGTNTAGGAVNISVS